MGEKIPVISLWQPWATWIALGWKTIETRTHKRFMGLEGRTIGIHASIRWDQNAIDIASPWLTEDQIKQTRNFLKIGGAIICTVFAYQHSVLYKPSDSAAALCPCEHGDRYGLFLRDVKSIEAISCRGKQGIWYHDLTPTDAEREG